MVTGCSSQVMYCRITNMESMCIEFINSEFRDFRGRWVRDDLLEPGWLEQFLSRWGLQVEYPLEEGTQAELLVLRGHLRRMIEALENSQIAVEDLTILNAVLLKPSLKSHLVATQ